MTKKEAVNWLINLIADIGKSEHHTLWHYEQALYEIRDMLQSLDGKDTNVPSNDTISRQDVIELVKNSYYNLAESMEDTWAMVADVERLSSAQPDTIPLEWIQRYADDWEDMNYAYDNPILGMLEDWRREQNEQENNIS